MLLELETWTALVVLFLLVLILKESIMGGKSSKRSERRHVSSYGSAGSSSSRDSYGYPQSPNAYPQQNPYNTPLHHRAPAPFHDYSRPKRRLDRRYSRIADDYHSLDEVTTALSHAGLESSNLIVGIDFTKSNEWTASTHDQDVFSFHSDERFCNGFEEVLSRYRDIVPRLRLAGPTSFAPIIEMAMTIVEQSGGQYHVLLIIADGQVTRSVDTQHGQLSPQEEKTIDAIVKASEYPLSIVLVGVGDGPWDMMKEFDDNIPARAFDNFQFVNFTEIMSESIDSSRKEREFALSALMEIPSQYKATIDLGILGSARRGHSADRVPLPPPHYESASSSSTIPLPSNSFQQSTPTYYDNVNAESSSRNLYDNKVCPICLTNDKDMAFGCGHQTCCDCGENLECCPICRSTITTRIKLY
ncbi:E3 ubiquitin-protein ligase RGLG2-like isoform X4 [Glycine soja]|uniref:E3 ubiquitin-protein ligase RGLG2-like isoform X4 n=1 Tax=Glycine soja TaxID=3848 RepID=UPI00103F0336|nr:E3 ubiquitin-protein ligase RGLG2-like isoform X4 [Glycine soja]